MLYIIIVYPFILTFREFIQDNQMTLYDDFHENSSDERSFLERLLYAQMYCGIQDLIQYEKKKNTYAVH